MTSVTIPTTATDLEDFLGDKDKVNASIEAGQFAEVVKAYATNFMAGAPQVGADVKAQIETAVVEYLQANNAAVRTQDRLPMGDVRSMGRKISTAYAKRAPGAKVDKQLFEGRVSADADSILDVGAEYFGQAWFKASGVEARAFQDKLTAIQAGFGSNVPADGGFLVPEILRSELLRLSLESGIVRQRARVIPMELPRIPFPVLEQSSNASGLFGGVQAYWTEEAAQLQESQAKFNQIALTAHKLTEYTAVPNELIRDSPISVAALIMQIFPEALAWFEDLAFLTGDGVGQPRGIMRAKAMVKVAKETGQAAATILWANILKMYSRMLPSSLGRAIWVANIDTFPQLMTMTVPVKNVAGTENVGGSAVMLADGTSAAPLTLLGRPILFTEKVSTLGGEGDLSFLDFGHYLIGDRQTMQMDTSEHERFRNDMTSYRFIERVDGMPWLQNAITPAKGANTLSPYVTLAARS